MTRAPKFGALVVVGVLALGTHAVLGGEQAVGNAAPGSRQPQVKSQVTVPFTLDHNRMIVEVGLVRPDGTIRKANAWVDTGTEVLIVTEAVPGSSGSARGCSTGTRAGPRGRSRASSAPRS